MPLHSQLLSSNLALSKYVSEWRPAREKLPCAETLWRSTFTVDWSPVYCSGLPYVPQELIGSQTLWRSTFTVDWSPVYCSGLPYVPQELIGSQQCTGELLVLTRIPPIELITE
ncbi:hypothetical protein QE152_g36918 [Popillia japonica]|uniref:Uncharacterized protein n=1 Tax=Popillia japonica TaxID=7064 RepID=A0AAW1IB56_POPJA